MKQTFSVSIESPQSGFMSMRLRAGAPRSSSEQTETPPPPQQLVLGVAHAPYDSLHDLIEGLTALAGEGRAFEVRWNCEPEEYDLHVTPAENEEVELRVTRYPDHRRRQAMRETVFSHRAPKMEICLAFWRELRELHRRSDEDVFDKNWRRPFPQQEMQEFTRVLRSLKRD